ncbi:hypothetical protein AB0K00_25345 [Dactylosporangium sp. NPDC049525]|uniref:hypothetical protein n=1 Tax=Dactylosporangium sp. NPDC049525 TaxID=3154730 RepID=UPI00342F36C5
MRAVTLLGMATVLLLGISACAADQRAGDQDAANDPALLAAAETARPTTAAASPSWSPAERAASAARARNASWSAAVVHELGGAA